jgi:hypothetical protein
LSLFETLPSCEFLASKGIKCLFYHPTVLTPSGVHLRRSCSHLARSSFSFLWHVCNSQKNHPCQVASAKMSLLHSALVQVLGHLAHQSRSRYRLTGQ